MTHLNGNDLRVFENDAFNTLCRLKSELNHFISIQPKTDRKHLIHARDLIFHSKLKNICTTDYRRTITKTFNTFMQGITYFQNQHVYNMNDPIYHRDGSCSQKHTMNHDCLTKTLKNKHSKYIETCYIERLVYDRLWTDISQTQQDKGHLDWLTNTKISYQSCFPNGNVEIDIEYDDSFVPIQLVVTKYNHGKIKSVQTYRKHFDGDTVVCKNETRIFFDRFSMDKSLI